MGSGQCTLIGLVCAVCQYAHEGVQTVVNTEPSWALGTIALLVSGIYAHCQSYGLVLLLLKQATCV